MSLFKNKYRVDSVRLEGWNYSESGAYFVTICTKNRINYFGYVNDSADSSIENIRNAVSLNNIGKFVREQWLTTTEIRKNVTMDEFIIMPNHLHGIIVINDEFDIKAGHERNLTYTNKFGPQRNNLSSIIRGFKSVTTKHIRKLYNKNFAWQSGFYDHIIRDESSLNKIREYIYFNPVKWKFDKILLRID